MLVSWLEVKEGTDDLFIYSKTFYTVEDSVSYLERRIATGLVYDFVGSVETNLGGEETTPLSVEENLENGFAPVKARPHSSVG